MTKRKAKEIKAKEIHLSKEAIKRLVKVTDTPQAWAVYERLWSLSEQALSQQGKAADADHPDS